jgi:hypothetical protein
MNSDNIVKNSIGIGFWRETNNQNSNLPFPIQNKPNYIEGFIEKLSLLKDEQIKNKKYYRYRLYDIFYSDDSDNNDNNDKNDVKLANLLYSIQYKGSSRCRLCGCRNGSQTLYLNGYAFPSGYFHYINEHNIEVPIEFQQMICNLKL